MAITSTGAARNLKRLDGRADAPAAVGAAYPLVAVDALAMPSEVLAAVPMPQWMPYLLEELVAPVVVPSYAVDALEQQFAGGLPTVERMIALSDTTSSLMKIWGYITPWDEQVLLAVMRLTHERLATTGTASLDGVSFSEILRTMGRVINGRNLAKVTAALRRIHRLVFETETVLDLQDIADAVRLHGRAVLVPGTPLPLAPGSNEAPLDRIQGGHVFARFDLTAPRVGTRPSEGDPALADEGPATEPRVSIARINGMELESCWLTHAAAGHLTWLDLGAYAQLGTEMAQVLYRAVCVRLSRCTPRQVNDPLVWDEAQWAALLNHHETGWVPLRTAARRKRLGRALEELLETGLLTSATMARNGCLRCMPSAALRALPLLRGTTLPMQREGFVLYAHCRGIGITAAKAYQLVTTNPEQLRTSLQHFYWKQEIGDPVTIGYVIAGVRKHYELDANPAFARWQHAQRTRWMVPEERPGAGGPDGDAGVRHRTSAAPEGEAAEREDHADRADQPPHASQVPVDLHGAVAEAFLCAADDVLPEAVMCELRTAVFGMRGREFRINARSDPPHRTWKEGLEGLRTIAREHGATVVGIAESIDSAHLLTTLFLGDVALPLHADPSSRLQPDLPVNAPTE